MPRGGRFATTLPYQRHPAWRDRAEVHPGTGAATRRITALVKAGRRGRPLVLNGFDRVDQVSAVVAGALGVPVLLTDCTWHAGDGRLDRWLTAAGVRALRLAGVRFCVSSQAEVDGFVRRWGVPADRVRVLHWYHALPTGEPIGPVSHEGPVVSGGRSYRDYRALLEVAPTLPRPLVVAATPQLVPHTPPGVRVGEVSPAAWLDLLRTAGVVVVPLRADLTRSAGQTTYLTAMALGKTVVVTDTLGVGEHVEDGRTGWLVPPDDPAALSDVLTRVLDPASAEVVARVRAAAAEAARTRFSPEAHVAALLALVDEL